MVIWFIVTFAYGSYFSCKILQKARRNCKNPFHNPFNSIKSIDLEKNSHKNRATNRYHRDVISAFSHCYYAYFTMANESANMESFPE